MKVLAYCLLLVSVVSRADEAQCLASIMYAEARGESTEGVVAVGQASVNRATNQHTTVCKITGVQRREPAQSMIDYYVGLARSLLMHKSQSVVHGADSWERSKKPSFPGKITRRVGDHTFYILQPTGEHHGRK